MNEFSRYERQFILKEIGREGQQKLDKAKVAIIGLGALGSVSANMLARAGVGELHLIDRDYLEMNNLQRQVLYSEKDLAENLPKAIAAKNALSEINSEIKIKAQVSDVNPDTIYGLLDGMDLILDGTDNFETRFLINDYALENEVPWIYGGAVGAEGMSYVVLPFQGPCLRCLFGEAPGTENAQTCDQVGILAPVAHLIASFQTMEAIKILAQKFDAVEKKLWKVDLWSREFKAIAVYHLMEKPCSGCCNKEFPYLNRKKGTQTVTFCGRNSVQIVNPEAKAVDLGLLATKLAGQAEIYFNDHLLKLGIDPYEITIFASGRAIVKGTEDAGQAKSVYAKYVGA